MSLDCSYGLGFLLRPVNLKSGIPTPGSTQFVIAGIDRYSPQPARKVLIRPNLIDPRKDFKENILREILNVFPMPEKP
jgi:hypothetical protein